MLHTCHYCNEHKGIRAFHQSEDDVICKDCYEANYYAELEQEMEQAFILAERDRLKDMMIQIDLEELPF